MFATSFDCSWALQTIASFDVVMMSVGHLNPKTAIFSGMYSSTVGNKVISSTVGNEVILFESFLESFWIGLSNIFSCLPATM